MTTDWADDIVLANLADEPALSDELGAILDRLESMDDAAPPSVVLDFSAVTYINSSNIAQLLRLRQSLEPANRQLRLVGVDGDVLEVMRTTGLDRVLSFSPDMLTALASVQIDQSPDAS
ncbi:MAG: STAS domain-containing protein [Phycisphaera sp.]|nr:MAG: STAS domain-containing protein [Phycisphaera sp.]